MKKVLSFVMALAMCLTLTACGGDGSQNQTSQPGSGQQAGDSDLAYIKANSDTSETDREAGIR